jgi:anaerobic magnesium-protoporphyrin IX monomethyl ester cyclase
MNTPAPRAHKVLVVTGGLLNEKETSPARAVKKQVAQWRASESAWLDLKVKLVMAEPVLLGRRELASRRSRTDAVVQDYFAHQDNLRTPELTEVVLATALRQQGMDCAVATVDDIFAKDARVHALLDECDCVFLSCTLLRDLSEIEPLVQRLRRPHNRLVLGGALAGLLVNGWPGMPGIDVLAVGYGELLVPPLVGYIRSGFSQLVAPPGGNAEQRQHTLVLRSGVPASRDLDFLPTPDWAASAREHGQRFPMIHYESVRGCPYRCNFCNYPYLFDDTRFRYKSAQRIADDWARYVEEMGVEYITCLDSLFTMPRRRLVELCELLVQRNIRVKWICYARADDLAHREIAATMKAAGAHQVQIGIESGDQQLLDNMDKQCSVESNHAALANCRELGLTSVISLIVGFPGETAQTISRTYEFLRATPPDFYFLATFSTRAMGVPVLNDANRQRFGLDTDTGLRTVAPYWRHSTMSAKDVGAHVRELHRQLMGNRVALNAALFYSGMLRFEPHQREALLNFQQRANDEHPLLRGGLGLAHAAMDWFLARDYGRWQHRVQPAAPRA